MDGEYHVIARNPGDKRGSGVSLSGVSLSEARKFISDLGPTFPNGTLLYVVNESSGHGVDSIYEGFEIKSHKPVLSYKKTPNRQSKGGFKKLSWGDNRWGSKSKRGKRK